MTHDHDAHATGDDHAGHDHGGHSHDHTKGASGKMLAWALVLTGSVLIAELIGAWAFKSLALLSDAAHMFTDAAALAIALAAIKIGERPADEKRSFGYRRFEILAAAFNAVLLFVAGAYILFEGILRLLNPEPVGTVGMLAVAVVGLVVNFISMRLLMSGKDESLNLKGAYLEVWADMLGSLGVVIGAGVIMLTGWTWVDPILAIAIGLWVLPRTWTLLRDTTHVLLEGVPQGMSLAAIRSNVAEAPGVADVHDLHVWSITTGETSCSVHVVLTETADPEAVRIDAIARLERFGLTHVTVQTEREPCADGHGHA